MADSLDFEILITIVAAVLAFVVGFLLNVVLERQKKRDSINDAVKSIKIELKKNQTELRENVVAPNAVVKIRQEILEGLSTHRLVFPFAYEYPLYQLEDGGYASGVIRMNKSDNPPQYYGEGEIIYPFEGRQGFLIMDPSEVEPKAGSIGSVRIDTRDIVSRIHPDAFFTIEPSSKTTQLKQNNIFLALTLVFVAFGVAESHSSITAGLFLIRDGIQKLRHHKLPKDSRKQ